MHCPVPCEVCRRGVDGTPNAYCNQTPCACSCHRPKSSTPVSVDVPALLAEIRTLTESRDQLRAALVEALAAALEAQGLLPPAASSAKEFAKALDNTRYRALLRRIVAAYDTDRAGHDMRCMPALVGAVADAREAL